MDYTTELIARASKDESGQQLCQLIEDTLTLLSNNGLDDFGLIPVIEGGHTVAAVVSAKGIYPSMLGARQAFETLTGFDNAKDIAEFLGGDVARVQREIELSAEREQRQLEKVRTSGEASMNYIADLIERESSDTTGQELGSSIAIHMTYLSDHGLDHFLFMPVQNGGRTVGVIIAARGQRPHTTGHSVAATS